MSRMKKASSSLMVLAVLCLAAAAASGRALSQPAAAPASLDYEFFKTKVEPVFLEKRPGHTRCVVCHTINNAPFHLVPLSPGSTSWNEQQSRQNFELIQRVAVPGVLDSPLVKHPLAAGGRRRPASRRRPAIRPRRGSGLADIESFRAGSAAK